MVNLPNATLATMLFIFTIVWAWRSENEEFHFMGMTDPDEIYRIKQDPFAQLFKFFHGTYGNYSDDWDCKNCPDKYVLQQWREKPRPCEELADEEANEETERLRNWLD